MDERVTQLNDLRERLLMARLSLIGIRDNVTDLAVDVTHVAASGAEAVSDVAEGLIEVSSNLNRYLVRLGAEIYTFQLAIDRERQGKESV